LCKSCRTCFKFYCMFYFICDRSFTDVVSACTLYRERASMQRVAATTTNNSSRAFTNDTSSLTCNYVTWQDVLHPHQQQQYCHGTTISRLTSDDNNNDDNDDTENYAGSLGLCTCSATACYAQYTPLTPTPQLSSRVGGV